MGQNAIDDHEVATITNEDKEDNDDKEEEDNNNKEENDIKERRWRPEGPKEAQRASY